MRKIDLSKIKVTGVANNSVLVYNNVSSSWVASNTVAANVDWSYIGNVPYANSSANGVVKIVDSTSNTSATIAASANSVKVAFDAALANGATAYANAVTYTNSLAATAYSNATTYASSIAATAYSNATTYAATIAGTAYSNGVTYAGTIAATAYSNATSYADTKAATAFSNAASRADAAYTNAVAYAASNTYVNSTFAPLASPTFTGTVNANNISITGNLTISGTTTYINSTNLNIGDNIITLNADVTNVTAPTENAGVEVNRGSGANVALRWNETLDVWQLTIDGTNYSTVATNNDVTTAYSNAILYAASNSYVNTTFLKLSGGTMSGAVSGITTLAAGNTTITGFANVSANLNTSGTLSANVITVTGNVTTTQTNLQVDAAGTATAMAIVFGG